MTNHGHVETKREMSNEMKTSLKKKYVRPELRERPILSETKSNDQPGLDHYGYGSDAGPVIS